MKTLACNRQCTIRASWILLFPNNGYSFCVGIYQIIIDYFNLVNIITVD